MRNTLLILVLGVAMISSGCEMAGGAARDAHNITGVIVDLVDPLADKAEWGRIQREHNRTQTYFERHKQFIK
jgi:hypothetical protein